MRGVHLTRLNADGTGKADSEPKKVMIGKSSGFPIIIAPPNDLLGMCIVEGIEDGLSIHEQPGLARGLRGPQVGCQRWLAMCPATSKS